VNSSGVLATHSSGATNFGDRLIAKSLVSQANKIVNNADVSVSEEIQLIAKTVDQNKTLRGEKVVIQADEFNDTIDSRALAKKELFLKVEKGTGFKGQLQGDTVVITMDDFQLAALKQVIARVTQLHINKDVVIDKDLLLKNTLHLWAGKLINKAQVTAQGDFIVQTSSEILLNGRMDIQGTGAFIGSSISSDRGALSAEKLYLQAKAGDVSLYQAALTAITDIKIASERENIKKTASKIIAGRDAALHAAKNIEAQSIVLPRQGTQDNFDEQMKKDTMSAGGNLTQEAGHHLLMTAVENSASGDVTYKAGGTIIDAALKTESKHSSTTKDCSSSLHRVTHEVSHHKAGGTFSSHAGGDQQLYAPEIEAKKVEVSAEGKITAHEVHDTLETKAAESHDGGLFSQKREKKEYSFKALSKGLSIKASDSVEVKGGDDVALTNVYIKAPKISLKAVAGAIRLLSGKNQSAFSSNSKSSNILWNKQKSIVEKDTTYTATSFDGELTISGQVFVEATREQMQKLVKQIEAQGIIAIYTALEELHDVDIQRSQGPSAALAAVVVVAVSICTAGTGAALGAAAAAGTVGTTGVAATVISTMTAAAFTSLCCQASLALLANEGNIIKAAETLASTKTLENLGVAMLTAGATAGISSALHIPSASQAKNVGDHLARQVVQSSVSTTAAIAQGRKADEALVQGLKGAAAGAIASLATTEIGQAYLHHDVDFIGHKFLHGLVGGATGALMSDNPLEGAASGAFGAVTAEMIGELVLMNCHKIAGDIAQDLQEKNIPLTQDNIQNAVQQEIEGKTNFIKLMTSGFALLAGQDVSIATFSATIALDNNLSQMACKLTEFELDDILSSQSGDFVDVPAVPGDGQTVSHYELSKREEASEISEQKRREMEKIDPPFEDGDLAYEVLEAGVTAGASMGAKVLRNAAITAGKFAKSAITKAATEVEKKLAGKAVQEAEVVGEKVAQRTFKPSEPHPHNRAQFEEYKKESGIKQGSANQEPRWGHGAKPNPDGTIPKFNNAEKFAKEHDLPAGGFSKNVTDGITIHGEHLEPHTVTHADQPGKIFEFKLKDISEEYARQGRDGKWLKDREAPFTSKIREEAIKKSLREKGILQDKEL